MAAPMCCAMIWQRTVPKLSVMKCLRHLSVSVTCRTSDASTSSSQSTESSQLLPDIFRTSEHAPENQGAEHIGQFYTIPTGDVKTILPVGFSRNWEKMISPFQEASIMVRQPAVEILQYLKMANYSHPPVRYMLYGRRGSGKTMTLSHVIHYCHSQGWLIVHVPCANSWNMKSRFDYIDSVRHEGMYDRPGFSVEWLKHFKGRNERFLQELKTHERYEWSRRESTEQGQPLSDVVEQGIARPKNANDAIGVILKELQRYSLDGVFKMLFVVKAVNGFFSERTIIRKPGGYRIPVKELTLTKHFRKMLEGKWINGAIVTSVDQNNSVPQRSDYKPLHLLGKEGFEAMEPFIPVFVDDYSDKEFESCIAWYKEKRWLQNEDAYTEEGKAQLMFLTEKNPGVLHRVCAPL